MLTCQTDNGVNVGKFDLPFSMVNEGANSTCFFHGFRKNMPCATSRLYRVDVLGINGDIHSLSNSLNVSELRNYGNVNARFLACLLGSLGEFNGFFARSFEVSFEVNNNERWLKLSLHG